MRATTGSARPLPGRRQYLFRPEHFQGAFDVIQVGILDANPAQDQISLPNEDLLYPPSAGATLPVAMLQ
jgi:hypothetical protein